MSSAAPAVPFALSAVFSTAFFGRASSSAACSALASSCSDILPRITEKRGKESGGKGKKEMRKSFFWRTFLLFFEEYSLS